MSSALTLACSVEYAACCVACAELVELAACNTLASKRLSPGIGGAAQLGL